MKTRRFSKNDEGFVCIHCNSVVPPLGYTSRNHCNKCLWSIHIDINPGDRSNDCGGPMFPVAVTPHPKKGFVITHRCKLCNEISNNKSADDDDRNLLISYTNPENIPKT